MKVVIAILGVFITMPIWYYLMFKILQSINASELMWFLFWIYIPVGLFIQIVRAILDNE